MTKSAVTILITPERCECKIQQSWKNDRKMTTWSERRLQNIKVYTEGSIPSDNIHNDTVESKRKVSTEDCLRYVTTVQ